VEIREAPLEVHLAPRESDIVRLLILGCDYGDIGERLFLEPSTVKNRVHMIAKKCGFNNRTQVAVWFALHPEQLSEAEYEKEAEAD
jgi:DNA-binding NarL/FixJ family response regulator